MSTFTIKQGFDLRLSGSAEQTVVDAPLPAQVAIATADFPGIKPKCLVVEGQRVQTGQPLFLDKNDREVQWASPCTGTVTKVVYGERRFLLQVVIAPEAKDEFFAGPKVDLAKVDRAGLVAALKQSGLWPLLRQRPIGRMVRGSAEPVAIFVNGMDSEPLAADPAFAVQGRGADLQAGIDALRKLTSGTVFVTVRAGAAAQELRGLKGVQVAEFAGPHPSGLVGTHIHRLRPLKPGETAWYLKAQELALIGQWLRTGQYPFQRVVAVAGECAPQQKYFRVRQGAVLSAFHGGKAIEGDVRAINGTVLNGTVSDGFLGFYAATLTVIPEGTDKRDLFGWALPQFGKLSFSRSVMSWLMPRKEYSTDARLNGGHRPIVNLGLWDELTPLGILPSFLVRAIQSNDVEEAVKLGLLEVTEEDVALCTWADPCKIDVGSIVRKGLDMVEKEG